MSDSTKAKNNKAFLDLARKVGGLPTSAMATANASNREAITEDWLDDNGQFHALLSAGIQLFGLLDKDIAREFGVSRPTVTRWRNGVNAPYPAMRKLIYTWLEKRAKR